MDWKSISYKWSLHYHLSFYIWILYILGPLLYFSLLSNTTLFHLQFVLPGCISNYIKLLATTINFTFVKCCRFSCWFGIVYIYELMFAIISPFYHYFKKYKYLFSFLWSLIRWCLVQSCWFHNVNHPPTWFRPALNRRCSMSMLLRKNQKRILYKC